MNLFNDKLHKGKEGLKKFSRRAQEKVLQKLGTHVGTNDPRFDDTINRVERLDKNLHTMYNAMNDYILSMEQMQLASVRMASTFESLLKEENEEFIKARIAESYSNNSDNKPQTKSELPVDNETLKVVENFVEETKILEQWTKKVISNTCKEMIVRPAGEKLKEIPGLHKTIAHRQQKLLDYDAYRRKQDAEKNPESEQSLKIATKLESAHSKVNSVTNEVITACATIENGKTKLFLDGFASLVACQTMINLRSAQKLEPYLPMLPQAAPALCMICSKTNEENLRNVAADTKK